MITQDELKAVHEAAHAVISVRSGFRVSVVTIDQAETDRLMAYHGTLAGECGGVCVFADSSMSPPDTDCRDPMLWPALEKEIAMGLAAAVAEGRLLGTSPYAAPSWHHEYHEARHLAESRGLRRADVDGFLRWLLERADRLCDEHWPEIQAVQQQLLERRTVEGAELHAYLAAPRFPEASCF